MMGEVEEIYDLWELKMKEQYNNRQVKLDIGNCLNGIAYNEWTD